MQLHEPFAVITPTVDGQVLEVLAGADSWFTVGQVTESIGNRSAEGIRKALARLLEQGVVCRQPAGRAALYRLNRDHLAAPAIIDLAKLRSTFYARLRSLLSSWDDPPHYAAVFGSGPRGTMNPTSDIDVFLIRDIGLDPNDPEAVEALDDTVEERWEQQISDLTDSIYAWTGNPAGIMLFELEEIRNLEKPERVLESIARQGITVYGDQPKFSRLIKSIRRNHESISTGGS